MLVMCDTAHTRMLCFTDETPQIMTNKRRILYVDDEADMCCLISTILSNHEVVYAHSKVEALHRAMNTVFDLYLLDYYLPDGTGLELCLLIRDFDDSTPVLFVTATRELSSHQLHRVKAQGVINKIDLPHALVSAVPKVLTS